MRRASAYEERGNNVHSALSAEDDDEESEMAIERRVNLGLLLGATHRYVTSERYARRMNSQSYRRHSMVDLSTLRGRTCLPVDRMKIDVGLCGQYLIMHRRELHLQNVMMLLKVCQRRRVIYLNGTQAYIAVKHLIMSLSMVNASLRDDFVANQGPLADVTRLRDEVSMALNAAETRQTGWSNMQDVLRYQVDEMDMKNLWRSVQQQRSRVAAVRQSVFDAPPGTRPKPGTANRRFFRVQTTLDSEEQRLVDWLGRTESEAEEEAGLPEQLGGMWVPPFEELKAYAEATREEEPRRKWWWPFTRS